MLKTISSSDLRTRIAQVLNEVSYGRDQYVIQKFGEPAAAIINMEDFRLLQRVRQEQAANSVRELLADLRHRAQMIEQDELDALVEEARTDYYHQRKQA